MKVVLDTNILVSALKSSNGASYQIMKHLGDGKFEVVISVPLVMEYEDVLKRFSGISEKEIEGFLDYICYIAESFKIYFLWRPFLKDVKDDHVLELAFTSGAEYIVTYNKKDFNNVQQLGIKVIDAKEFLQILNPLNQ